MDLSSLIQLKNMISKEEVIRIAKLARLELTEKEVEKMQKDMSAILDYFNVLEKVKTPKIKFSNSQKLENKNVVREDKVTEKNSSLANNLIAAAPDKKDGYIKVKSIL